MIPQRRAKLSIMSLLLLLSFAWGAIVQAETNQQESNFASPILVVNASFLNVRVGPGVEYAVLVTAVGGTELPVLGVASDGVWYQVATDAGVGWVNVEFTLPRGDFRNVPLVVFGTIPANAGQGGGSANTSPSVTTTTNATPLYGIAILGSDLHEQPDTTSLKIRSALPNDPNTIYPIQSQTNVDGENWYYINVPNIGMGWVNKAELRALGCGMNEVVVLNREEPLRFDGLSSQAPYLLERGTEGFFRGFLPDNVSSYFELIGGDRGIVATSALSARSDDVVSLCEDVPTMSSMSPSSGASVTDLGQGGGVVAPSAAQAISGNHVVINTGNLNVRSGPAVGFSAVATVPGGTELAVIGRAPDDVWLLVQGAFGSGWINSEFALFRGNYSTVPLVEDVSEAIINPSITASAGQGGGEVVTTTTNSTPLYGIAILGSDLHEQPDTTSLKIRSALPNDPNTIYPIQSQTNVDGENWYYINVPNIGMGWVNKAELRALGCGMNEVVVLNREEPLRFDGLSSQAPYLLERGTEGFFRGFLPDNVSSYFELIGGDRGIVATSALSARSDDVVSLCQDVPMLATMISTSTSSSGMSAGSTAPLVATGNRVVVNTGNLNIRTGPAAGFAVVATVPGGSELAVTGVTPDGVWYRVQGTFGEGWVNGEFTVFRGNYSAVPVIDY
jgi:uncharacterized protein YgiM (DUF1202 family)